MANYNQKYYEQFTQIPKWHRFLLGRVDRKEPTFSYLKTNQPQGKLLDVACGNGLFLRHAEKIWQCQGVDSSKEALKIAKENVKKSTLSLGEAEKVDKLGKAKFDIVTCFDLLEHVDNPAIVIEKIRTVMKDDGLCAFSMPNGDSIGKNRKQKNWYAFADTTHKWFLSREHWEQIFSYSGLVVMKNWGNGMSDTPYFGLPAVVENLLLKYPSQILAGYGFPWPTYLSETLFFVCKKNPNWGAGSNIYSRK